MPLTQNYKIKTIAYLLSINYACGAHHNHGFSHAKTTQTLRVLQSFNFALNIILKENIRRISVEIFY